ncbi:NAD(+) synthase [[Clostridium] polysaccharolyticum]|uniref:Glutamine-dependent NAD(+) synthetase n=1 Tax=[Clostridium] polysaccharolyticum TaxID=29364 RepID=A0A1H9ZGG7_9FIRM|nr:NAD(+) synthase [[Clostridium] polysaccharolyticum]SES80639.1 NAD+ synthase (glutamine-hydrolysing) [[Clostridium] polysaccharolyticum]
MKRGFLKVCAATPDVQVANPKFNTEQILKIVKEKEKEGVKLIVFPELCMTAYTCGDLFLQDILLEETKKQLVYLAKETKDCDSVIAVGFPMTKDAVLYNAAAVLFHGKVIGIVPKTHIPNYSEFYEARHFAIGNNITDHVYLDGQEEAIPFGTRLLFRCSNMKDFILGLEICEDVWVAVPPSAMHVNAGATVIANLSASDETTGKAKYRRKLISGQSSNLICAYIYADEGEGESTSDLVYSGHNIIAENGIVLKESQRFLNEQIVTEIDLQHIQNERRRISTYLVEDESKQGYTFIDFAFSKVEEVKLTRKYRQTPFVPSSKHEQEERCNEILLLQAMGLKKRLQHTHCKSAVIGISGGLDSTLALLVTALAFDKAGLDRKDIICVTMPCFGTTDRTYTNAVELTRVLGATLKEIPIHDAVALHLESIGHDLETQDVTYENGQARMRTLVLMNIANMLGGMVIGTGDLSELALGWATYNGDHMSMYGVNSSVPKTLVRYLVKYYADTTEDKKLANILNEVLDTPVSPELLPPKDGEIAQKTEDIVGPYELHDFFLYYILRFGYMPAKIFFLATEAFKGKYDGKTIYKWLASFYRRFFAQQFKRSCLPDGPKIGSVAVSPRGDLRMPSDASVQIWLDDLKTLEAEYGV